MAAWVPGFCPCGTVLKRLSRVNGRLDARISLGRGLTLNPMDLDEALFCVDGIINYQAELSTEKGRQCLRLWIHAPNHEPSRLAMAAASAVPAIATALAHGSLKMECLKADAALLPASSGMVKRTICDRRILDM
jgi:phenylacetate-coenzyme A ligase PaaK-like adenylate-forming protein